MHDGRSKFVEPLVSILIPAFNAQQWIADTLRSALAQTWPKREIIVVDDGSTDSTLAIAKQFESQGVKVFTQKNMGAAASRNRAFALCQGDYIQWLDADDLLAPDKISRQIAAVNQSSDRRILLSSAWGKFMYRYHRTKFTPTRLWCDLSPTEWLLRKMGENLFMQTATWLVSRELTEAAGPWNTELLGDDDGEYFCRVLLASEGVRFVPDAKVYYRASGLGSLSHMGRCERKAGALWRSMIMHIDYLRSLEDSERVRNACLQYLQTLLIYFYPEFSDIIAQVRRLTDNLGGHLGPPHLSWKYSWIRAAFGWRLAKRARFLFPDLRFCLTRYLDKLLFRVEKKFCKQRFANLSLETQPDSA